MKPHLLKIPLVPEYSFSIRRDVGPHSRNRWHYHPELELVHIKNGTGTRFIGDSIDTFEAGDLLLIGANLPHYWRYDAHYFQAESMPPAEATVVHFTEHFWGESFLALPENKPLRELLERARLGIRVTGECQQQVITQLRQLLTLSGLERLIGLLTILKTIAFSQETVPLSRVPFHSRFDEYDLDRIDQIYAYTFAHASQKIQLADIAKVAHLSPQAFCRYFKSRTRKTYSQFVMEVRIRKACNLLIEKKLSVAQICYESGFRNFSHFNRQFKMLTQLTPLQYQAQYWKQ